MPRHHEVVEQNHFLGGERLNTYVCSVRALTYEYIANPPAILVHVAAAAKSAKGRGGVEYRSVVVVMSCEDPHPETACTGGPFS